MIDQYMRMTYRPSARHALTIVLQQLSMASVNTGLLTNRALPAGLPRYSATYTARTYFTNLTAAGGRAAASVRISNPSPAKKKQQHSP